MRELPFQHMPTIIQILLASNDWDTFEFAERERWHLPRNIYPVQTYSQKVPEFLDIEYPRCKYTINPNRLHRPSCHGTYQPFLAIDDTSFNDNC